MKPLKVLVISGSRADYGLLEWPIKTLREDKYFSVSVLKIWGSDVDAAYLTVHSHLLRNRPDVVLLLGDRFEILAAALTAHLQRVPIAHLCGGDISRGSYDDAMRDCITRLAEVHFPSSPAAAERINGFARGMGFVMGNLAIDYIKHAKWKKSRGPLKPPYVVVSYHPETADGTIEFDKVLAAVNHRRALFLLPNMDRGSDELTEQILKYCKSDKECRATEYMPHGEFLNALAHAEEFIGNSSALYYEAPSLGVKCTEIGKRQQGRVVPDGDGTAHIWIREGLKKWHRERNTKAPAKPSSSQKSESTTAATSAPRSG